MEKKDLRYYAKVHSIESFGAVDGPGIRVVVFMQGCALRCKYCHNPDTWSGEGELLMTPEELINKVSRFRSYFERSGGGITFSGGDPLRQPEFLIEALKNAFNTIKKHYKIVKIISGIILILMGVYIIFW